MYAAREGGEVSGELKPLHVQVAEALGCTTAKAVLRGVIVSWECFCSPSHGDADRFIPLYDTGWSATGPLIEEHGIALLDLNQEGEKWVAFLWGEHEYTTFEDSYLTIDGNSSDTATGDTPLVAVCNLIVALSAVGKLEQE